MAAAGFGVILASRAVLGAAEGPAAPVAIHALYKWFPPEARALPSALLLAAAPLGVVLAAPALGSLITHHGWRSAFVAVIVLGAAWSAAWLLLGRDGDEASNTAPHGPEDPGTNDEIPGVRYGAVLRTGTFLGYLVPSFAAYWATALALSFLPAYLEDTLGYDTAGASKLVALPWLLGALALIGSALLIPRLLRRGASERAANNGMAIVSTGLSGLALLGLVYGPAGWLRITCLVLGFSLSALVFPVAMTDFGRLSPARLRGGVLGVYAAAYSLGAVVAPLVTGSLLDSHGHTAAAYNTAFVITAVLLLAGAASIAAFVDPERDRARLLDRSTTSRK
ncbi:MFS transporter [Peterkaempfera sp. SMS 1(5)a]|uniref:MFS transporter n=1 Tax=Peterkaempfera podocarpi TaxID=3232308 RepID=UPI00366C61D4